LSHRRRLKEIASQGVTVTPLSPQERSHGLPRFARNDDSE
jgi:hypothetical protein